MKNFRSIESLRAWMAWWVLFGHALQLIGVWSSLDVERLLGGGGLSLLLGKIASVILHGDSAVRVFIIVSGFVITHLVIETKEPYGKYLTRRFFRLAPVMFFCIGLSLIVSPLYINAYIELPFVSNSPMRIDRLSEQSENFWAHIVAHGLLLHGLIPAEVLPYSATTLLAPAWSIGLEWQFYLMAPFLIALISRGQTVALVIAMTFLVIRFLIDSQTVLSWQYDAFFFKVPDYFLVGIFCRIGIGRLRRGEKGLDMLLLSVLILLFQDPFSAIVWLIFLGIMCYECGLLDVESLFIRKGIAFIALNKNIENLGRWSYSTYLVHIPIFSLFVGGYVSAVGVDAVSQEKVALLILLSFPVVVAASYFMYKYVENPPMKFIKRFLGRN